MEIEDGAFQGEPDQPVDIGNIADMQTLLQQLHLALESSTLESEGQRDWALGLKNFYLQMNDPSIEALEEVASSFITMPFDEIKEFQSADYIALDNPQRYFNSRGVELEDEERVVSGILNSSPLIQRLARRFNRETGGIEWDEDLDPKTLAQETHLDIQISRSEREIKKVADAVRQETDLSKRHEKALVLKQQIMDHVTGFPYKFYKGDDPRPIEPTWDNFLIGSRSLFFKVNNGGGSFHFQEEVDVAEASILRYSFERRLEDLPKRDRQSFDELRLQFGAKGANLIILSEMVNGINDLRRVNIFDSTRIKVPEFQTVPVDAYRAWNQGKLDDSQLRSYFEWANNLKTGDEWSSKRSPADYIVRSSAVFSEDGENVTGAGIYDSVQVPAGATFQEFKEAVERVYRSTESDEAKMYRQQNGIEGEEMGLVIQRFIHPEYIIPSGEQVGYINSRLTGVPGLMEVVTRNSRNFVKRQELDFVLAMEANLEKSSVRSAQQFLPDINKIVPDLPIKLAQLVYVIERIWGSDVQAEFVANWGSINFVQVRDLPKADSGQEIEVQFPDEDPIHSGASIGVGDVELEVLDNDVINADKNGIVIFEGNREWTLRPKPYSFPREGVVVVANEDGLNGHIQTLAAERGLICVFPDRSDERGAWLRYDDLLKLRRVRVVSNGIEARLYPVNGEKDPLKLGSN